MPSAEAKSGFAEGVDDAPAAKFEADVEGLVGASVDCVVRLVVDTEVELRKGLGEEPTIGEYFGRFPDETEVVRDVFRSTDIDPEIDDIPTTDSVDPIATTRPPRE